MCTIAIRSNARALNSAGSVAIEYSLLGAFLGLGLLAALVGTKTTLRDSLSLTASKIAGVSQNASKGMRVVASVTKSTAMQNNATLAVTTTTYTDGSVDVQSSNTDFTKLNFNLRTVSIGPDGKTQSVMFNYPSGNFDLDVYAYRADGSYDITNTNGAGDTFVYNAKTVLMDGYSVYQKHMISASRPLYQDEVQVSDISNPSNPVVVGTADRAPDGSITTSGASFVSKYLP
jgi:Flp pilus assembly pilin Flp